jgi:hypothetical protein
MFVQHHPELPIAVGPSRLMPATSLPDISHSAVHTPASEDGLNTNGLLNHPSESTDAWKLAPHRILPMASMLSGISTGVWVASVLNEQVTNKSYWP